MESRTVRGAMNMRGARRDVKWKSMALVTVRTCGDCMAVWQWQGRDKPCRLCVSCVNVCVCGTPVVCRSAVFHRMLCRVGMRDAV